MPMKGETGEVVQDNGLLSEPPLMPLSSADILWNRYIFSFLLPFTLHSANLTPIDDACNKQYLTEGESWGTLLSSSKVVRVM